MSTPVLHWSRRTTTVGSSRARFVLSTVALLCAAAHAVAQPTAVIRVDASAPPGGDGLTWATAYNDLQQGFDACPVGGEVWVAGGPGRRYRPSPNSEREPGNRRSRSFRLDTRNDTGTRKVLGGFFGNETSRDQRNPTANPTILTADLNGDDLSAFRFRGDNADILVYTAYTCDCDPSNYRPDLMRNMELDGLVLQGANGQGAIFASYSNVTLRNCEIRDTIGAGITIYGGGSLPNGPYTNSLTIDRCTFAGINGYAIIEGFGHSGYSGFTFPAGITSISQSLFLGNAFGVVSTTSNCTVTDTVFDGTDSGYALSVASIAGGNRYIGPADVVVERCRFLGNYRHVSSSGSVRFRNCLFTGSRSTGVTCVSVGHLQSCTIARNGLDGSPAVYYYGNTVPYFNQTRIAGELSFQKSIIWQNFGPAFATDVNYPGQTGWGGPVINYPSETIDPLFVDPDGPDETNGTLDDNYDLSPASPLKDAFTCTRTLDILSRPGCTDAGAGSPLQDWGPYEFQPVPTVTDIAWIRRGSGNFTSGANWQGGISPGPFNRAIFDALPGSPAPPPLYTVSFPDSSDVYNFAATVDVNRAVNWRLQDRNYSLSGPDSLSTPSLLIGATPLRSTSLGVYNDGISDARLSAGWAVLGEAPQSSGRLTIADPPGVPNDLRSISFELSRGLVVGNHGRGTFNAITDGNTVTGSISSNLIVAKEPGSLGQFRLSGRPSLPPLLPGAGTRVTYQGLSLNARASVVIGDAGGSAAEPAELIIENGARLDAGGFVGEVVIGRLPGSHGRVTIDGPGSAWNAAGSGLILGKEGAAELRITAGATLDSNTFGPLQLAAHPGASASILIDGPGSRWTEHSAPIEVGLGNTATLTIRNGGRLEAPNLVIFPGGVVSGNGTIVSQGPLAGVFNVGTIRPGNSPGTLTIQGDFLQVSPDPQNPDSGTIEIEVAGPADGQYDRLVIAGSARLGGGLIIRPTVGSTLPATGDLDLTLIQAAGSQQAAGRFDVAFLPPVQNNPSAFFNVRYGGPEGTGTFVRLTLAQLTSTISFNPQAPQDQLGVPTGVATGDLNGDGLADLAVSVTEGDTAPGSVFVLMNKGVLPNGDWRGFEGAVQFTAGVDPSAVAIGDIDDDGKPDVAVANRGVGGGLLPGSLSFFRNTTTPGTTVAALAPAGTLAVGRGPSALAVVNLDDPDNADGKPEIAVTHSMDDDARIYAKPSRGDFAFLNAPAVVLTLPAGAAPSALATAIDSDNGKRSDLLIANPGTDSVTVVRNASQTGTLNLNVLATIPVGRQPVAVRPAKLRGPAGRVSFVTSNLGDPQGANPGSVSVVVNTAGPGQTPAYAPAVDVPAGVNPVSIAALDMDDDTDPDLAVLTNVGDGGGGPRVRVLRNDAITIDNDCPNPPCIRANEQLALVNTQDLPAGIDPRLVLAANLTDPTGVRQDLVVINQTGTEGGGGNQRSVQPLVRPAAIVVPTCPPDFNADGNLDPDDLADYIGCFFTPGGGCPQADFNGDGNADPDDLSDYIGAFFAGC